MSKETSNHFSAGMFAGAMIIALVSCLCAWQSGNAWRNKCIESGAAYYKLDPKTGDSTFTWKYKEAKPENAPAN